MKVFGPAMKFGDNVDTDLILPGKYLILVNPKELAQHAMEGVDPAFPEKAKEGVIIVAGKNFGCGSSREQAPLALKHAGVSCVLAESFARIFFRNAINIGLPVSECETISTYVENGDELFVNLETGEIHNLSKDQIVKAPKLPSFVLEILSDGGLIKNLQRRLSLNDYI